MDDRTKGHERPDKEAVLALRHQIQERYDCGITLAQDICATMLSTTRGTWQQWERGDRTMHAAFYELAVVKVAERMKTQQNAR